MKGEREGPRAKWIPPLPHRLRISNQETGLVWVTTHAWERFCERCPGEIKYLAKGMNEAGAKILIVLRLQESFRRARKYEMSTGYRLLRESRNDGETAEYFIDELYKLRFTVGRGLEGNDLVLLNCERPWYL